MRSNKLERLVKNRADLEKGEGQLWTEVSLKKKKKKKKKKKNKKSTGNFSFGLKAAGT